jgi:acyl-CoA synthetase (NDP forming)
MGENLFRCPLSRYIEVMARAANTIERAEDARTMDAQTAIKHVRVMMRSLGGFHGAQVSESGDCINVRMAPGNERKIAIIRRAFPAVEFRTKSYRNVLH